MGDILEAIASSSKKETQKTVIMRRANLDFRTFEHYFQRLRKGEFIIVREERVGKATRVFLAITEKGEKFRQLSKNLMQLNDN